MWKDRSQGGGKWKDHRRQLLPGQLVKINKFQRMSLAPFSISQAPVFVYVWEHKQFVANFSVVGFVVPLWSSPALKQGREYPQDSGACPSRATLSSLLRCSWLNNTNNFYFTCEAGKVVFQSKELYNEFLL